MLSEEIISLLRERDIVSNHNTRSNDAWLLRAVELLLRAELQRQNGVKKS